MLRSLSTTMVRPSARTRMMATRSTTLATPSSSSQVWLRPMMMATSVAAIVTATTMIPNRGVHATAATGTAATVVPSSTGSGAASAASSSSSSRHVPLLGSGSNTTSLPSLPYDTIAATELHRVQPPLAANDKKSIVASSLWADDGAIIMIIRRPFCVLCRNEAAQLTTLLQQCRREGIQVKLVGVAKEDLGTKEFREVFNGDIFVDDKKTFFQAGNRGAHMTIREALFSPQVWKNVFRALKNGHRNTSGGEGQLMGGLLVMGAGDQGELFEYREKVFGDHANHDDVLAAVRRIKRTSSAVSPSPSPSPSPPSIKQPQSSL